MYGGDLHAGDFEGLDVGQEGRMCTEGLLDVDASRGKERYSKVKDGQLMKRG